MSSEEPCSICFEELDKYDVAILSCNHRFHYKCIKQWMNHKKNYVKICPICDKEGEIVNIIDGEVSADNSPESINLKQDNRARVYVYEVRREPEYEYICCNIL